MATRPKIDRSRALTPLQKPDSPHPGLPNRGQWDPDRRSRIEAITPRSVPARVVEQLRPAVIELILRLPFESVPKDRRATRAAFAAGWMWLGGNEGAEHIDWRAALSEQAFAVYAAGRHDITAHSKATMRSVWLAIARDAGLRPDLSSRQKHSRPSLKAPYTAREASALYRGAQRLPEDLRRPYIICWVLAFQAGARPVEIARLTWGLITHHAQWATVRLVNLQGVVREVDVNPIYASVLAEYRGEDDELVIPGTAEYGKIWRTFDRLRKSEYRDLRIDWSRARHTFIVNIFMLPIPLRSVAYLADLNKGSHAIPELLPYCTAVEPGTHNAELRRVLRRDDEN